MDLKIIKDILIYIQSRDISNEFKTNLKINFDNFMNKNEECSKDLFEYILYCLFHIKKNKKILLGKNIILLNQEYVDNHKNQDINNNILDNKLILIPYIDSSENNWGMILLKNLFSSNKNDIIIKIIASLKVLENSKDINEDIIHKLNYNIKKEELNDKIEKLVLIDKYNSSKVLLNFINELLDNDNIDEIIKKYFKEDKENKIINESLNIKEELFEIIEKEYENLYNGYINFLNLINENSEKESINQKNENDNTINTYNPEKESISLTDEDTSKNINTKENENININKDKENNQNKEKEKEKNDIFDELAKHITKNIMNLDFFPKKNDKTNQDTKLKLEKKSKSIKHKNNGTKRIKFEDKKNQKIINDNKEKEDKKNNLDKNEDGEDINLNKLDDDLNNEHICGNKKLDETTKNTINNILEYVLNEMKYNKKVFRRKYSQRNKRARINEQKEIEIIEEEDKESSTSEMCNEKKLIREIRDSISSIREEFSFKDDLRESYKNRSLTESNIFDEKIIKDLKNEKAQTNQKINQDLNKKEQINIIKEKAINKNKIQDTKLNDKRNNNDFEKKEIMKDKNENNIIKKENVIQINIDDNKPKIKDSSEINDKNSSNNDNLTISNNNSIIENNSMDIENLELDISKNSNRNSEIEIDEKNLKNYSPKDNKRVERKNDTKLKNKEKNIIVKNIINKNNQINNISINTIKAQNIIIVNNIVPKNKKNIIKNKETKIDNLKQPEDSKIPKDNKNKKKNVKININKKSKEQEINPNINLLIKEAFSKNESKFSNKKIETINIENNEIDFGVHEERRFSDADKFNMISNQNKEKNFIKKLNNNNFSDSKNKNNTNKNIINTYDGNESNKLIVNNKTTNENNERKIKKNKTNNKNIIHNKIHSFIRSKTQEFKNMNISDKNDDFFNINTDCLIC